MGSISLLGIIVVAIVLMYLVGGVAFGTVGMLGAIIINSLIGFVLLFLANAIGIKIPINVFTILLVAIFGLLGLALLALLALLGVYGAESMPSGKR